jgi:hypothetical protein
MASRNGPVVSLEHTQALAEGVAGTALATQEALTAVDDLVAAIDPDRRSGPPISI